jgi:FkbM family methyltransferase
MLKTLIRNRLHPLVWDRLGQVKQEFRYTQRKYHYDSDLKQLFDLYLNFENGFYVDIGANDGRASSNTYHLEKFLGWGGILIEPIMHVHFRSREIRDLDRNTFHCCALVDESFENEFVELSYSGLMTVARDSVSDFNSVEWAELGAEFLGRGEHVQKTWSEARTLKSVLNDSSAPKIIDFLSIDVEGSEFSILKNFDFNLYIFRFILIETKLNSPTHKLLLEKGFIFIIQIHQNLFFKNENYHNV